MAPAQPVGARVMGRHRRAARCRTRTG